VKSLEQDYLKQMGEWLKDLRLSKKITLRQMEEDTKIRIRYLEAIENGDYDILPGRIYALGFLRTYSRYVGANEEDMVECFKKNYPWQEDGEAPVIASDESAPKGVLGKIRAKAKTAVPEEEVRNPRVVSSQAKTPPPPQPLETRQKSFRHSFIWVFLIAVIIVACVFLYYVGKRNMTSPEPENTNPSITENPLDQEDPGIQPTPAEEEPAASEEEFLVKVNVIGGACWISVSIDGGKSTSETLPDGAERTFTGEESISIRYGNPAAVQVTFYGETTYPLANESKPITVNYEKKITTDTNTIH